MTFYKLRKVGEKPHQFYNPDKPGNRVDPTFDFVGKKYYGPRGLVNARKARDFCSSTVNTHWRPERNKAPVATVIEEFIETETFVGVAL